MYDNMDGRIRHWQNDHLGCTSVGPRTRYLQGMNGALQDGGLRLTCPPGMSVSAAAAPAYYHVVGTWPGLAHWCGSLCWSVAV